MLFRSELGRRQHADLEILFVAQHGRAVVGRGDGHQIRRARVGGGPGCKRVIGSEFRVYAAAKGGVTASNPPMP